MVISTENVFLRDNPDTLNIKNNFAPTSRVCRVFVHNETRGMWEQVNFHI